MIDSVMLFRDALQDAFGLLDWLPIPDGKIHRFHVPGDKPSTLNGWYVLYLDGIASGAFGSWKAGGSQMWSSREPSSPVEAEQVRQRIEQARQQREADQFQRQTRAAHHAVRLWRDAQPASTDHPYLTRKGCQPHGLRQHRDALLVPLYVGGRLGNLQRIYPDGAKRFLSGGRVKGAYSTIGSLEPGRTLYVCEGWATGATIHESTGDPVACAMNAGNLLEVGQHLRITYPDIPLIIAGDDDRQTEGNPGRTTANKVAAAIGALVTFPDWPADAPATLTDFNDLACWSKAHDFA